MILYWDFLIPKKYDAITIGPQIVMRKASKGDIGLLEHEKVHVKQFWKFLLLHPILYYFSKKYRCNAEVEAFKKQLEYSPNSKDLYAYYLSTNYGLDITVEEAKLLL
jgi:hypothetical protein